MNPRLQNPKFGPRIKGGNSAPDELRIGEPSIVVEEEQNVAVHGRGPGIASSTSPEVLRKEHRANTWRQIDGLPPIAHTDDVEFNAFLGEQ